MEYKEIQNIVGDNVEPYIATDKDGKRIRVRLWKDGLNRIAMLGKGCKRHGYILSSWQYGEWVSLEKENKKAPCDIDIFKRVERRVKDAVSYLEKSGLWTDILADLKNYQSKDEETRREMCKALKPIADIYENFYANADYAWCGSKEIFISMAMPKCWKRPNYFSDIDREFHEQEIQRAIREKKSYCYRWEKGYDNSIEISQSADGKVMHGFYSEEFRGCGNGHYYILLDETHAIFYEDD